MWQDLDLERLVARAKRGDPRAWDRLVEAFQSAVYSIPRRMGLGQDDCEDVFQETFSALHSALDRIEDPRALPKWVTVTASRIALRTKRIRDRSVHTDDASTLEETLASEDALADDLAEEEARAQIIRASILDLPEKCRVLLSLLYFEAEKSYQEISSELGMPVGAIGPNRARCLEKLKKIAFKLGLKRLYQDEGD